MKHSDVAYTVLKYLGYLLSLVISFSFTGAIVPASLYLLSFLPQHLALVIPACGAFSVIIICTFQQWMKFYSSQSNRSLKKWIHDYQQQKPKKKFTKYQNALDKILSVSDLNTEKKQNIKTQFETIYLHYMNQLYTAIAIHKSTYYPASVFKSAFKSLIDKHSSSDKKETINTAAIESIKYWY